METLSDHLQHRPSEAFGTKGLNEIILSLYTVLKVAVRDGGDELRVKPLEVVWSKQGEPLNHLSLKRVKPTMTFTEALTQILDRDEVVRSHLRRVAGETDEARYQIVAHTPRAALTTEARS